MYQHQAKMYFDTGDYSRSRFYAEKSLDLRRKINPANTASTELILNALDRVNS
ncbi:hypothetical protein [Corticicoccus populi]|uniref:Tetratricopeptide repeat protein n=1 Tax=Corticicoccus populi TaxID=1812821 RepID=A0ABW5WUC3_9STAP